MFHPLYAASPVSSLAERTVFDMYLAQWASLAMRLLMEQPVKLSSLVVWHQNNLLVVMFVPYFMSL
jgi:hypothetical protein